MPVNPAIRRIAFTIIFAPGTVDYKFTNSSFTYLGEQLNVIFTDLLITSYINSEIYYSIDFDQNDAITVNSIATQGVTRIGRNGSITENGVEIRRLRISSTSPGRVDVILYNNPFSRLN